VDLMVDEKGGCAKIKSKIPSIVGFCFCIEDIVCSLPRGKAGENHRS